jgi:hypothetical protein
VTGDRHRTGAQKRQRVGWEFCHSIIDDHSRLAYTETPPRREGRHRHRVRPARAGVLRPPRHHGQAPADRQRVHLRPQPRAARAARRARHPAAPDPAAHPQSATGRSSATSKRSPANGPTDSATATPTPARQHCPSG